MKKVVLPVIGMTVLCFSCIAQEETEATAREMTEPEDTTQEDVPFDIIYADNFLRAFFLFLGRDTSHEDQENLDWARNNQGTTNLISKHGVSSVAEWYLILKGDASDLDRISPSVREPLAMRVAGTNLVNYHELGNPPSPNRPFIVPSVINSGPQERYVIEILFQYWKTLEIEYREGDRNRPFRDPSKIPAELLTMVVSFDADGTPVCNVDLAKYGLTMPELDVPVKPQAGEEGGADIPVCAQTRRQEFPNRGADSLRRLWLPSALIALTLLIGGIYARRKKLK